MRKFLLILILFSAREFAQQNDSTYLNSPDSVYTSPADSLLSPDSIKTKPGDIDTVINTSSSDSLIFVISQKEMYLYGTSEIQYKQTDLTAANIKVDFETGGVEAEGVPTDTSEKYAGTPVLKDKGETYEGFRMKFNFKSQRGFIASAGTENEGAYYTGSKIKKVDKDTYFIKDGIYTTCDKKDPDYFFYSPKMKVVQKQQVMAEWIWLFIGDVPLPVPLPFAVFPLESGRRSGIIPPVFGDDGTYGKYFARFGYFWAISDYMDWNLTGDYYTRGSYRANSRLRYAERYNFTGTLQGDYSDLKSGLPTDPDRSERVDWRIMWSHNQSFTPTMRFDANLEFTSGNYTSRNVTDFNELLRNEIVSNATFSKTWDESGNSLTANYNRRQVLQTGEINEVLPSLTFTKSQSYPFRGKGVGEQKWYELFGYNYTGQFQNNRTKTNGNLNIRGGFNHQISAGLSPKIGYLSIAPSVRYQERWYNKRVVYERGISRATGHDTTFINDEHELNLIRTFGLGVTASTKFYGIFPVNSFGINAVRHTVNPSISYNYNPDFSKPFWGYYGSYLDPNNKVIHYDKFQREVFGGAPSSEAQRITFSLGNIFEMKTQPDPSDTTSKEQKIQLLNLSASMSYNFAADSMRLSDLGLQYRTQIGDWFNFSGSSNFTPYDYQGTTSRINKFLVNEGKGFLRLTNFSFSISTTLSGEKLKSAEANKTSEPEGEYELQNEDNVYKGLYSDKEPDFAIPWDLSLTYNYSLTKPIPNQKTEVSNLSGGINFNLTPKWKFSFTGSYDFQRHDFAAPQIRISRDLHCWLMDFTWNPIGTYRGYRFEIRVKAPQLQDLKVTKQDQFYSGRGY
ncbi:MAG TPA: putative LPS assembly protein LptD [Ignavibacteriaceae bacterium]|nr:putative LPS assembly protein LptD [Ignavibacteriaceae bacterium]